MLLMLQDECSFVSLRDIVRAMILFDWFMEKLNTDIFQKELKQQESCDSVKEVCYTYMAIVNSCICKTGKLLF